MKKLSIISILFVVIIAFTACGGASVDLTRMNGTTAYSTAVNIVQKPSNYADKTIKAKGRYSKSGSTHYVYISDGECCEQSIAFTYSGNYPSTGKKILVQGVYKKSGSRYCIEAKTVKVI